MVGSISKKTDKKALVLNVSKALLLIIIVIASAIVILAMSYSLIEHVYGKDFSVDLTLSADVIVTGVVFAAVLFYYCFFRRNRQKIRANRNNKVLVLVLEKFGFNSLMVTLKGC
ncbi:hypothetical protein FNH22_12455 [Fulvivirga sp. M361]|uniref:hypothetical protein n=1 Tax=Fulvivirga sp. M361 TaxID=2594266 RepID=UPI001179935B|nr:hypothetical protein [Fulvivirga sp. M361]TRX58684.1 hypothetical protein FNH22_12455 [Fulvivirga sp. M361]